MFGLPAPVTEYRMVFIDNIQHDDPAASHLWLGENTRQWAVTVSPASPRSLFMSFVLLVAIY